MMSNKSSIGKYVALALMSASASVMAANAAEENVDEVIVTAQNRAQSVKDVPIAMEVVDAETLKSVGFAGMDDVTKISPSVQLNQDQGTVKITVRGVGTTSGDEAQDTSVVVDIDGEYINRPNVMGVSMFDLERVEVLRGPQGTLYGRNSTGGAIHFITRKPGKEFAADASVSYGSYNALRADAGVDLPLGETASVRIAGFYDDRNGYNKHPAGGGFFVFPAYAAGRSDDNHSAGGRISLQLDPSDALTANLAFEYADRRFTPGIFAAGDLNATGNGPTGGTCNNGFTQVAPAYAPQLLCVPSNTNLLAKIDPQQYGAPLYGIGELGDKTWAARARVAYQFNDAATLTYTGGYRNYKGDQDNRRTLPVIYQSFQFMDDATAQSHELRLNGQVGKVIYQVGGFYFKENQDRESGFMLPSFIFGQPPFGPNGPTPGTFLSYFGRKVNTETKSLFGQVDIPLSDQLTAVVGLRHTDNKRTGVYVNASPFGRFGPDFGLVGAGPARKNFATLQYVSTLNLGSSENKLTWLAGLNYKPNDNTLIYGKVSTGFKGGGFDSVGDYKPETNTAIEVGLKQTFGSEGQHSIDISAFHYDYKDLQVSVLLDTAVGGQTFNAGKAKNWGVEAAGTFRLTDADTVRVTVNYLNAQFKELFAQFNVFCVGCGLNGIGDLDPNTAGVQQPNFAGNKPAFSPELVGVLGYDHVFQLGGAGSLTARASLTTKSKYYTDFYNYADGTQDAYTTYDASLDYAPANGKWGVQVYGRNLANKRPLTYGSFVSAGPDDIFNWQFGAPRTYGVRFSVEF